jgi:hypothetical protein
MLTTLRKQRGITMWCLILLIGSLVLASMLGVKLYPFYNENMGVKRTLNQVKEGPEGNQISPAMVQERILQKLYLNDVRDITRDNFREHFTIEPGVNGPIVYVHYTREAAFFKNVYLTVKFEEEFKF